MIVLCGARGRLREEVIRQHLIPSALYPMSSVLPISMAIYTRTQDMPVGGGSRRGGIARRLRYRPDGCATQS